MSDPIAVELDFDVVIAGEKHRTFKLREPLLADHLAVAHMSTSAHQEVAMLCRCCEPAPTIEEMSQLTRRQYEALRKPFAPFFMA